LARRSYDADRPAIVLGAVHSDLFLAGLEVPDRSGAQAKQRPGRRRYVRGGSEAGTYLLAWWRGRLCLATPARELVGRLEEGASIEVVKLDSGAVVPPTVLHLDEYLDEVSVETFVPVGGKRTDPRLHLRVRFTLRFPVGSLDEQGRWRTK
ncbi:MAG: hypothetical protein QNJ98_15150, partial [Planctomycetota bacterium]|nr:hypothetical protein [Planctomycetota bacterium]